MTKKLTLGERIAVALIDALERFLDKYPWIEEWFVSKIFFVFAKPLDLIRLFAHAKRRWAREDRFLEKVGMGFLKVWFRALWKFGRWVFGVKKNEE